MGNGASIPFEKKTALTLKEDGNVAFKNGLYPEAIYYYSRAINLLLQEYGGQYHEIEKISDSILNGEKKVPDLTLALGILSNFTRIKNIIKVR